ncbi:MAG: hypothetical protein DMF82_20550 [Acidobacteria bacterium]|nr:MAG: hypothetical protein DMF82_20550 [Acidobacteriota bacterium]
MGIESHEARVSSPRRVVSSDALRDRRQRRLRHRGRPRPAPPGRRGPHQPGLGRARSFLFPPRSHVRLRRPDAAARHRALRPRALRAAALRAGIEARGEPRSPCEGAALRGWRHARLRPPRPGRGLARAPRPVARGNGSRPSLLRDAARSRGPGPEVAEILLARGLTVTFVIRENWYFPLALDEREAAMVAEHLRAHGVDVRLGVNVVSVARAPDGSLSAVRLEAAPRSAAGSGSPALAEAPCDLLVCAIGVVPNTGFLADSGLRLSKGGAVEVDDALRASAPDVWAAGDCANVTWADGSRRPEQLWYTARDQGRVAAASMRGDAAVYRRGTWYNSAKFFDLEYTTAGWVPVGLDWDNTPLDPGPDVREWFQRSPGRFDSQRIGRIDSARANDRVVGFNMLGGRWNHEVMLDWIDARRSLAFVLDHLGEAQFDEELSPRWRRLPSPDVSR